ncbi:hypothetical protein SAMN04488020_110154 [Palleronia marisminoris]|uniref:Uncharacterized protein n=1 Tax=Palleronia marisminoris TaxID=315423 RepID=A0A1Y5TG07_9RHOB|nr:hypothetical protein SAMN04488020_110154 [Palleronia marisminoris]SLN59555.1 hypothetical protein PAM7066_02924 [Palleronia marisminoris]
MIVSHCNPLDGINPFMRNNGLCSVAGIVAGRSALYAGPTSS